MPNRKESGFFPNGFAPHSYNFIKKLVFHECSVPFQLYVETFLPCFLNMVYMITFPFLDDIIRNAAEDMAPHSRGSKRPRRGHIRRYNVPTAEERVQGKAQQGLRHVLTLTQPLETIGYAFLLYGATERFFYNWSALLYDFQFCGRPPSTGPLQRHATENLLTSTGTWQPLFLPIIDVNRANWPTSNTNVNLPFGHYSVTVEMTVRNLSIDPIEVECGFIAAFSFSPGNRTSGKVEALPGQIVTVICHEEVYFPGITGGSVTWQRRQTAVPIGITVISGSVSIYNFTPGV